MKIQNQINREFDQPDIHFDGLLNVHIDVYSGEPGEPEEFDEAKEFEVFYFSWNKLKRNSGQEIQEEAASQIVHKQLFRSSLLFSSLDVYVGSSEIDNDITTKQENDSRVYQEDRPMLCFRRFKGDIYWNKESNPSSENNNCVVNKGSLPIIDP